MLSCKMETLSQLCPAASFPNINTICEATQSPQFKCYLYRTLNIWSFLEIPPHPKAALFSCMLSLFLKSPVFHRHGRCVRFLPSRWSRACESISPPSWQQFKPYTRVPSSLWCLAHLKAQRSWEISQLVPIPTVSTLGQNPPGKTSGLCQSCVTKLLSRPHPTLRK